MNKSSLAGLRCIMLVPLLALIVACATTYQTYHAGKSGFLGDYSQLRKGHGEEALWVYINTNASILSYNKIMIDPATLYLSKDSGMHTLPKADVQAIVNYFIDLTKQSLRNRDRVMIRSFGTFVVRHKNPKQINCVRTGEKTMTREKDHVAFIPSNDFDLDSIV